MDEFYDYLTEFINHMAKVDKDITRAVTWYVFEDKRSGTVQERFDLDAAEYSAYSKMFRP